MGVETTDLPCVLARLSFLGEVSGTPTNYFDIEPPAGMPVRYPRIQYEVAIRDARLLATSLGREGFVLANHPGGLMEDFWDDGALRSVYYPAAEQLVRDASGAARVLVFDHTYRSSAITARTSHGIDVAVDEVHNDYTVRSGPRRVRELLSHLAPSEDAERLMSRRHAVFNVWRPINGAVEQWPLALCDMSSMRTVDFVDAELKWPHRTGFVCAVRHQPRQRWFYFSSVDSTEAIVFKCYDSGAGEEAGFGAHTAFADPSTRSGAKVRESVELRALAFF